MNDEGVAAVVVTYERCEVLRKTLVAVQGQDRPPDQIVVVDNGSGRDGSNRMVRDAFPAVKYVSMNENLGFAAGLAEGMRWAVAEGFDYVWLLDDDSRPRPEALERCLQVARRTERFGVVGLDGGTLRHGVPQHGVALGRSVWSGQSWDARPCDFVLVDGALVSTAAVARCGYPRGDFFMMMEDVEYTGRLKRSGWEVLLLDSGLIERSHLGSGGKELGGHAPPWRGYYQTRNHLRVAIDHGSLAEGFGWAVRTGKQLVAALLSNSPGTRIRLRMLGAWHALCGVSGRSVEPHG